VDGPELHHPIKLNVFGLRKKTWKIRILVFCKTYFGCHSL